MCLQSQKERKSFDLCTAGLHMTLARSCVCCVWPLRWPWHALSPSRLRLLVGALPPWLLSCVASSTIAETKRERKLLIGAMTPLILV